MLHDLLVAVMRDDGTFHELGRVGGDLPRTSEKRMIRDLR
jgi:hypothetical protein